MTKITFLGAGSTVFAKDLLVDILSFPELSEVTISLFDIDEERLQTSEVVAHKVAKALNAHPTIEVTTDREKALDGSTYALSMFQVGGYKPGTVIDFEIPKKYGLRQTIADTLGIGGIMRALRTIPVLTDVCSEMERLCPDVLFLNYVNPMAMNCWAVARSSRIATVGLCHSIPHTASLLARDIGVPYEEVEYHVAGINHVAFFLKFERNGKSLYPELHQVIEEGKVPEDNRVRYEMMRRLGYFVTESSEHFSEYVPYFIKRDRPDLLERFKVPLDEYPRRCERQIAGWQQLRKELETEEQSLDLSRSVDFGSLIIHSIETDTPRTIYGNVPNHGLIDNLPYNCCVEVPCLVDHNGVQPTKVGQLPPQLAAMMRTNINVQELTVEAALSRKKEHIYHAAMLDPHTAAELDLEQIWSLVDELITAHGKWLPNYA